MKLHLCRGPCLLRGWLNVDAVDFSQQVVADIDRRWNFARDGEVSEIYCRDGFEHVESAEHSLSEAARVLQLGGTLTIWVPHYKNPSAYRISHKRLLSWSYFDAFPEPHDVVQSLWVISNRLFISQKESRLWSLAHFLINLAPKWWERIGYVSNIEVVFERIRPVHRDDLVPGNYSETAESDARQNSSSVGSNGISVSTGQEVRPR